MRIPYQQQKGGTAVNTPNTVSELLAAILPILPNATLGEDGEGQIIIYTDLAEHADTLVRFGPFLDCSCDTCGEWSLDILYVGETDTWTCPSCSEQEGAR